jgi:hypothetical protein
MKREVYCAACGSKLGFLGQVGVHVTYEFTKEGNPEGQKLNFSKWTQEPVDCRCPIYVYRCNKCGRLELYDHNLVLPQEKP